MYTKLAFVALASAITTNASVMTLYSGPDCTGTAQEGVNVYDNTCAAWANGFQSFILTSGGAGGQVISTYSPDSCAGATYACVGAGDLGTCFNSFGVNYSGSNAVSSGPNCGVSKVSSVKLIRTRLASC